jgi:hypothetical protein
MFRRLKGLRRCLKNRRANSRPGVRHLQAYFFVAPGFRRRGGLKANRFAGAPLQLVILEGRITPSTVATLKVGAGERFPTSRQL